MDDNKNRIQCDKKTVSLAPRLTDVNFWNKLLKYLNISDLVILSTANLTNHKNLDQAFTAKTNATTHPYEARIRDRFLQLNYSDDCITNNPDCVLFEKTIFRYFGALISKVRIYYDCNYQRHNAKIEQVVLDNGLVLSEIGLINADISVFENISKPFLHVTTLKFENGWLGPTFFELSKWFPKLQSLSLNCTQISDVRFFKQENPNLIELSLRNKFMCKFDRLNRNLFADNVLDYAISNSNLKMFLALMPKLEHLSLCHDIDDVIFEADMHLVIQINFDLLLFIASSLMQLRYLKLNVRDMALLQLPRTSITFNKLKTLIVETSNTIQLTQLTIVSEELNHLEIIIDSFIQNNKVLAEFVGRFEHIEYLSIEHHPVDLEDDDLVHMINSSMKLKVLQIALHKNKFSDDLCYIIKKFDRLRTVRVTCIEMSSTDRELFVELVNENYMLKSKNWRGTLDDNVFEFKKMLT